MNIEERKNIKICMHVPGQLEKGMYSPERGESRWAQNLAVALAQAGYDVTTLSNPPNNRGFVWAPDFRKPESIHYYDFTNFPWQQQFDIFIDMCWFQDCYQRNFSIKAKAYIMAFCGVDGQLYKKESPLFTRNDVYYAMPMRLAVLDAERNPDVPKEKGFYLPWPLFSDWQESNFDKKQMVWAIKEAWHSDRPDSVRRSLAILKGIIKIQEKEPDAQILFAYADEFGLASKQAMDLLANIKNRQMIPRGIDYLTFRNYLRKSKMTLTNGATSGQAPIFFETIADGGVPLLFDSGHWKTVSKDGYGIHENLPTEEEIINYMLKLWNDNRYYYGLREYCKDNTYDHHINFAIQKFDEMVKKVIGDKL